MGNLLIVDDEVDLAINMKGLLEEEAENIFVAYDGKRGLDILKQEKIDLVVSDVKMPVMDGLTFFKEARNAGIDVPFIFYTGHGSPEMKKEVAQLGAHDLLIKPDFGNLELAVRDILAPLH